MVAITSKKHPNTWTRKVRRSLIFFTSVLVHCKGRKVRNKGSDLRRKRKVSSLFKSLRFNTHIAVNGVKIKVPVREGAASTSACIPTQRIKRAKDVDLSDPN